MHGLGNDFILLDGRRGDLGELSSLAVRMCDRHQGVGADGLLIAEPSTSADFKMRIVNSDGSDARMCGNGIRCMAVWAYEEGLVSGHEFRIETLGGVMVPRLVLENGVATQVIVDMGVPHLERHEIPMLGSPVAQVVREPLAVEGQKFLVTMVSMGNPHCVIFLQDLEGQPRLEDVPLTTWGPAIERHVDFPQKTNVEFVTVHSAEHLTLRVWERGAGVTMACGTGACAVLVAAHLNHLTGRQARVTLPGGDLHIDWRAPSDGDSQGHVFMTGPCQRVFSGEVHPSWLRTLQTV
jgi:diaminopimelate epimerase